MVTIPPTNELPDDIFESDSQAKPKVSNKRPGLVSDRVEEKSAPQEKKAPKTPTPSELHDAIQKKAPKPVSSEIPQETIKEIQQELSDTPTEKPRNMQAVAPPRVDELQSQQARMHKSRKGSTFIRILIIIITVGVVLGVAGAALFFFNPEPEATTSPAVDDTVEATQIEPEEIIDISSWQEYTNRKAGITIGYPEDYSLERYDSNLGAPNNSSTPQLIAKAKNGNSLLYIWIDTEGISQFLNHNGSITTNPLDAGTQIILTREDNDVEVSAIRYFETRSGLVQPDLSAITAYLPNNSGTWQYVFMYRVNEGEASEDFMKAFIRTVDFQFDTDGDGIFDDDEVTYGTDPQLADTDGDGYDDYTEITNGFNPLGEGLLEN